jgi:FkbM family methyltransferase
MVKLAKRIVRKFRRTLFPTDAFLRKITGLIHVGANTGQERALYAKHNLDVVWVEAIPAVFEKLRENLAGYPTQRAYQCLMTNEEGREYIFHVATNEGQSSSILPMAKHRQMYPAVSFSGDICLESTTLSKFVEKERLDLALYEGLVLDTQGSELMILKGGTSILPKLRFIKVEVPNFESYEGCCLKDELDQFMRAHGFRERRRNPFDSVPGLGTYYDVVYENCHEPRGRQSKLQ